MRHFLVLRRIWVCDHFTCCRVDHRSRQPQLIIIVRKAQRNISPFLCYAHERATVQIFILAVRHSAVGCYHVARFAVTEITAVTDTTRRTRKRKSTCATQAVRKHIATNFAREGFTTRRL